VIATSVIGRRKVGSTLDCSIFTCISFSYTREIGAGTAVPDINSWYVPEQGA